jgi:1-acyl-sn-glycerol-3-phosphate acyltransferase
MPQNLKEKIKDLYYYSWLSVLAQRITNIFYAYPYYHLLHKTQTVFKGSRPNPRQNYLIVANHISMKDPPLIGNSIALPVSFIAKKELFKNPILKTYMYLTSTIEVDRENPDTSTFKQAKKALRAKAFGLAWSVVIFIEGTRSKISGQLGRPNKGAIFLARLARVPIVPCGIKYENDKSITISFGEPYEIDYKADLEEQAWDCLAKISELSGLGMPKK